MRLKKIKIQQPEIIVFNQVPVNIHKAEKGRKGEISFCLIS